MKVINVVGARPNFMKIAPIISEMNMYSSRIESLLVHTGQHYDVKMSKSFFDDLAMEKPDIDLGVGSGTHAEQTGRIMVEFEKVCQEHKPDLVVVVGDVNSTMACAITAKKLGIAVAHVEAGLRSRDMSMPEEINRLCTDVLSDLLFTTDHFADENLRREGVPAEKIHFVGNVMIDSLMKHRALAEKLELLSTYGLKAGHFATMTLHRPSNVDNPETLRSIMMAVTLISQKIPVIFPVHPRTSRLLEGIKFSTDGTGIILTEPLGYLDFLHLNMNAKMVLTDSGGLQEETTVLGVPCITMRPTTERPITCEMGTNVIVGNDPQAIVDAAETILNEKSQAGRIPEKWDGKAAERIVEVMLDWFDKNKKTLGTGGGQPRAKSKRD